MSDKRLTLEDKLETRYCVENWVRDEQVKLALQRPIGRVKEVAEPREEPVAVVCFGPSLNQTWEKVRDFKFIFSCSGSHKFLVERGIVPTWHVEVDPRPHKVELIGPPQKETEYLIASACHPKVFEHLADCNVKLWHIFSQEEDVQRLLPPGEWALTGGSSVGLRAMTMARFFGFRDVHIFGMDGCFTDEGSHAAEHPNGMKGHAILEYEGKEYRTASNVLLCAKETFHELDMLKDVKATFYGEGLVQAMSKNYVPKPSAGHCYIGLCKPELISAEYRELNRRLHQENIAYGVGGGRHAAEVLKLAKKFNTTSILDFGCGKGYLAKAIPFPIWEYDPAIPGKDEPPRPADIVVCTDVLEHIEPENLNHVLAELHRCTRRFGYFVIHTGPAGKTLPDGRNTHLIQEDQNWWSMKLRKLFEVRWFDSKGPLIRCIAAPRPKRRVVSQSARAEHMEVANA